MDSEKLAALGLSAWIARATCCDLWLRLMAIDVYDVLERSATHEARHAVAYRHFGGEISVVLIDPHGNGRTSLKAHGSELSEQMVAAHIEAARAQADRILRENWNAVIALAEQIRDRIPDCGLDGAEAMAIIDRLMRPREAV